MAGAILCAVRLSLHQHGHASTNCVRYTYTGKRGFGQLAGEPIQCGSTSVAIAVSNPCRSKHYGTAASLWLHLAILPLDVEHVNSNAGTLRAMQALAQIAA